MAESYSIFSSCPRVDVKTGVRTDNLIEVFGDLR